MGLWKLFESEQTKSVPQTPHAFTLIKTSLSLSLGRGTVTMPYSSGLVYLLSKFLSQRFAPLEQEWNEE
jgi:hypothetical protein